MSESDAKPCAIAVAVINDGGVIAYPTEYCFGLGCDLADENAVERIFKIKRRLREQGLILVCSNLSQVRQVAHLDDLPRIDQIKASWPGPTTWLLPIKAGLPNWISGKHDTVAVRVSAHPFVQALCNAWGSAIVSTSANRHGQPALLNAKSVTLTMGAELDFVVDQAVGSQTKPSQIYHALSGERLR